MKYQIALPVDARMKRTVGDIVLRPGVPVVVDEIPEAVSDLLASDPDALVITEMGGGKKKPKKETPTTPGKTAKEPPQEPDAPAAGEQG